MKYSDLEEEWTELWNRLIDYIKTSVKQRDNITLSSEYWSELSSNPNLTIDVIEKNREKPWDWVEISKLPNITFSIVEKHPDIPWEWDAGLLANPNITPDFIMDNLHLPWGNNFLKLIENPNLTMDFVERYPDLTNWNNDCCTELGNHKNITLDILEKYRFTYNLFNRSENPNLTLEYVFDKHHEFSDREYPGWTPDPPETLLNDWDWNEIWLGVKIKSLEEFELYTTTRSRFGYARWGGWGLSGNKNLPWEIVDKYSDKPWDWKELSQNPSITWGNILSHPDKPWDYKWIFANPNVTWEIIKNNEKLLYDVIIGDGESISCNIGITPEIVLGYPEISWDWELIASNSMELGKKKWIRERRLRHIKAFQIQRHWRNCGCNPQFKLAQRCLLRLHGD
jgi:hypothetical protein